MKATGQKRLGSMLVELLLTMTMSVLLLGSLGAVVARVMRMTNETAEHREDFATLGRLAEQFREDVHACAKLPELGNETAATLMLDLGDGKAVEYQRGDSGVRRIVRVAGSSKAQEQFFFYAMRMAGWRADGAGVVLVMERGGAEEAGPGAKIRNVNLFAATRAERGSPEIP